MLAISAFAGAIAHFCISLSDSRDDSRLLSHGLRAPGTIIESVTSAPLFAFRIKPKLATGSTMQLLGNTSS